MRPFIICIHDASPVFADETRRLIDHFAPMVGRRLSFGVVPDWSGKWPLAQHPAYCEFLARSADEILLHGYHHRRARGWSPTSWLVEGSDEMSGLEAEATAAIIARGNATLEQVFGKAARGFIPPAWQSGQVAPCAGNIDYIMGFFSVRSARTSVPLATWTWDCGRWRWLGHAGHAIGAGLHATHHGIPTLAIHPRDLTHGYGPAIMRLARSLLDDGFEPVTPCELAAIHSPGSAAVC